ncbi:MAG TPA: twin-arginine translocation signal domain-containing protein, partial [Acidimicrobiia bacterium]
MINRRRFLGSLGAAGAAAVLTPYLPVGRAARGDRLRAVPHPLYREPLADPNAIPRFVQPLAVPAERGLRVDATAGGAYPF